MKMLAVAFFALLLTTLPSLAQEGVCTTHANMVSQLLRKYGETLVYRGLSLDGALMTESYASQATGTWTIVVTRATGQACMVLSGSQFYQLELPPPDPKKGDPL